MQDITDFLSKRKAQYLKRAENCEEVIESIKRCIHNNEKDYRGLAGYPRATVPDEHNRKRLHLEASKQNALLAKVEFIEELQEMYFEHASPLER